MWLVDSVINKISTKIVNGKTDKMFAMFFISNTIKSMVNYSNDR